MVERVTGRITRSTYWVTFVLPWFAIYNGLVVLDAAVGTWDAKERLGMLATIFVLLSPYPIVAAGVKRSHDRGRSGWFVLLSLRAGTKALFCSSGFDWRRRTGVSYSRCIAITAALVGVLYHPFFKAVSLVP